MPLPSDPDPARNAEVVLGFDYGSRRLGVAVGQTISRTASPLTTIAVHGSGPDWQRIEALIREWQPQRLLVGLPLNMRLEEQPMTRAARRFSRQLAGRYRLPVDTVDERLSSRAARERFPGKRAVDAEAAMLIIETWLSALPGPGKDA